MLVTFSIIHMLVLVLIVAAIIVGILFLIRSIRRANAAAVDDALRRELGGPGDTAG